MAPGGCPSTRLHRSCIGAILLWQGDLQPCLHPPHKYFHQQTLPSRSSVTPLAFANGPRSCSDEINRSMCRSETLPQHREHTEHSQAPYTGGTPGSPGSPASEPSPVHRGKVASHPAGLPHGRLLLQLRRTQTSQQEQRMSAIKQPVPNVLSHFSERG